MQTTLRTVSASAQAPRDPSNKPTDAAAIRAIAQAAVEVELFTIPLYMAALYSIQGMHQINSGGNSFYRGRLWPGPATSATPTTANQKAFNIVFSVFIQEMLHLQLAANMATTINAGPLFTSPALMNTDTYAWTCYGPKLTVIPHIIDLTDTINQADVKVDIGALSREQLQLFLAIEQPDSVARGDIKDPSKYFPAAPFATWQQGDPLPRFGTIGWMYQCYFDYLNLKYSDGSTLWADVFDSGNMPGQQNDQYNSFQGGAHPMREFMGFEASVVQTYEDIAFAQMGLMMDAITDQGEGSTLIQRLRLARAANLTVVEPQYQADVTALRADYPSFNDTGQLIASADAVARGDNDINDHYTCFKEILSTYVDDVVTWPMWLKAHGPWTAADLKTPDYVANPSIPAPEDVAAALNELASPPPGAPDYYELLSKVSVGSIAGVTTVLDKYWSAFWQSLTPTPFPFPSMSGSGDRMALCWAVFGQPPLLSVGVDKQKDTVLYHSCQGIDYNTPPTSGVPQSSCADPIVFHSCRGSNSCRAQGGCGFVQLTTGGGNCSSSLSTETAAATRSFGDPRRGPAPSGPKAAVGGCGPPIPYFSAPGDNKCGAFGGCAVPISASQLFPREGQMTLFKFVSDGSGGWKSQDTGENINFAVGDNVHDIAWKAYFQVMTGSTNPPPPPPKPSVLRRAFPPST